MAVEDGSAGDTWGVPAFMTSELSGRVVLITGASRGIGRRTAEQLAEHKSRLALTARSAKDLQALADSLRAAGVECEVFPGDLTDADFRKTLMHGILTRFGALDGLVNAAGVASFAEFTDSTPEILRTVTELNFFAPVELIRLAQPHLLQSSLKGRREPWSAFVLNIASTAGRCGIPSLSEHCGSKHALIGFSEAIRLEFAQYDIDVLLVEPGVVKTDDHGKHFLQNKGKIHLDYEAGLSPEAAGKAVVQAILSRKRESAVGRDAWWALFCRRVWPRGMRWIMRRKVARFARNAEM